MSAIGGAPGRPARCKVCGDPLTLGQAVTGGHCGSLSCMSRLTIEARAERARKRQESWERIGAQLTADTGVTLTAVVPFQDDPLVPLPPDRVAAFEAHLREAVGIAFSDAPPDPDYEPGTEDHTPPTAAGIAGCTACQGACCAQGAATKAFTGPAMMARQRLRYPEMDAEQMVQFYMDQLPGTAVAGACLYQGAEGCVLHRDDRAAICNSYRCWSLKRALWIEADNPGAEIAIGASREGQEIDNVIRVIAAQEGDPDLWDEDNWDAP